MSLAQPHLLTLLSLLNHSIVKLSDNFPTINVSLERYNLTVPNFLPFTLKLQELQNLVLTFGRGNTIAIWVLIALTLLNIFLYKLRQPEKPLPSVLLEEQLYSNSSLADILSETHNSYNEILAQKEVNGNVLNRPIEQLCRHFSLADIVSATHNFDEKLVIGQGGFGKVYKGVIESSIVAVKRLSSMSKQGAPQFWTEVELLSKFRHSHLVSLIGYCKDGDEMALVYEYMVRGALSDHLYKTSRNNDNSTLSWVQRLKICIGAARGLDYLHTGTGIQHRVIHRDMKSSNILLDENWAAKISDFGLSKLGPANQSCTHVSTNIKGTVGYLDPEYLLTQRLTRKSDVYAFGVVLIEVLCGRRAVDIKLHEQQWGLAGWAQQCIKKGTLDAITDPNINWQILPESLNAYVEIADQCLHYSSKYRPTMAEVVASLESALSLQVKRESNVFGGEIFNYSDHGTFGNQESVLLGESQVKPRKTKSFARITSFFCFSPAQVNSVDNETTTVDSSQFNLRTIKAASQFNLRTIKAATNNFSGSNKIFDNGFCIVYKGSLANGQEISVKRLFRSIGQGEVENELELLDKLQHKNIIKLLGFCLKQQEKILIYEPVPHKSLDYILFDPEKNQELDWSKRYKIIEGIAKGMIYLHEESRLRIIIQNLNPSNILLDGEMNAKISNFGMAAILGAEQTQGNTRRKLRRCCYMAPEYAIYGQFSAKSDVFSFGVLVLEIISGRNISCFYESGNLLHYAKTMWGQGKPFEFMDPTLTDSYSKDEVLRCIHMGLLCVQENVDNRPTMASVLVMLNN